MNKNIRVITKFLWIPKRDNHKWYWLKKVNIVQKLKTYEIIEWPLIPWGFGGPWSYKESFWEFCAIVDESNAIEIFIPNKDSPNP